MGAPSRDGALNRGRPFNRRNVILPFLFCFFVFLEKREVVMLDRECSPMYLYYGGRQNDDCNTGALDERYAILFNASRRNLKQ